MPKRRSFSAEFKAQVVLEVLTGVKSAAQVCREHAIKESVLSRWKQEFIERSPRQQEHEVLDLTITAPDQVWVSDIRSVRLRLEFVSLAVIMDGLTRGLRGWHLHRWLDQDLTLTARQRALTRRVPRIHHRDQGVQYAAHASIERLYHYQIQISMADAGHAWQNGSSAQSEEEEVNLSDYQDFADAYRQIGHFIEHVYQHKRIHPALGYLMPVEFETVWQDHHGEVSSLISA
ncbi:MAG: transposase [Ardenticatenaceae bacterium]|nr:transposase [Ardenticatenaceae bacterium]